LHPLFFFFFGLPISNLSICSHTSEFYTGCQQAISSDVQLLWINIKLCSLGILAAGSITVAGSSLCNKKKKKEEEEKEPSELQESGKPKLRLNFINIPNLWFRSQDCL